jgi:hypothetical protein
LISSLSCIAIAIGVVGAVKFSANKAVNIPNPTEAIKQADKLSIQELTQLEVDPCGMAIALTLYLARSLKIAKFGIPVPIKSQNQL